MECHVTNPLLSAEYRRLVNRVALHLAPLLRRASMTPEEVIDEAWLRLSHRQSGFESSEHFENWIQLASRHILLDRIRKDRKSPELLVDDLAAVEAGTARGSGPDGRCNQVKNAVFRMRRVHPRPTRVVSLRFFEGYSVRECASRLGVSERTVKRDSRTAVNWLRAQLMTISAIVVLTTCGALMPHDLFAQISPDGLIPDDFDGSSAAVVADDKIGPGVREALGSQGSVRVVVALQQPTVFESPTRSRMGSVRRLVAGLQEDVLANLAPGELSVTRQYSVLPALAVTILDPAGLDKLAANPNVVRIDVDELEYAELDTAVPLIRADSMQSAGHTGNGVVVAVLDSGIDTDHSDLQDDLVYEACFRDDDGSIDGVGLCPNGSDRQFGPGSAEDEYFHGTHVSGIVSSGGVLSPVGVAPDASIVAIKVLGSTGSGWSSDVIAGLNYIIDSLPDVDIVNMSLGSGLYTDECDNAGSINLAYATAINTLRAQGVATFVSSGNGGSGDSMGRPACVSGAISVGASDDFDQMASFTNTNAYTDIIAPGVGILSDGLYNSTRVASGTSMASPAAAGCAALLMDAGIATTPGSIEGYLKSSGIYVTDPTNGRSFPRIDCGDRSAPPGIADGLFSTVSGLDGQAECGGVGSYEINVVDGFISRINDDGYTHWAVGSSCWRFSSPYTRVYITANDPNAFTHWESPSGHIGFIDGHNGTSTTTIETSFNTNSNSPTFQAIHSGGSPTPDLLAVDQSSGLGAFLGSLSGGSSDAYPALAVHPTTGVLYAGGGDGHANLYTVNPATGALTPVGPAGSGVIRYGGMDFRSDGTLFASVNVGGFGGTGANHLAIINISTGLATLVGPFGSCSGSCTIEGMDGIAFDPGGVLYGTVHSRSPAGRPELHTINTSTGAATLAAPLAGDVGSLSAGLASLQFVDGSLFGGTTMAYGSSVEGGRLVEINKVSGGTWFVGGASATGGRSLSGLALGASVAPPSHDDLADAITITSLPRFYASSTTGATSELGEAFGSCGSDHGNSIWWRYTAPADMLVEINTNGSAVNAMLGVWTGPGHPLDEVACDDDSGVSGADRIYLEVSAGVTYYIRLVGFAGASGPASMNVQEIPITDCAVQTQIPTSECLALVALFESTDGWNWTTNTGWNQTNEPCSWYGVACTGGHVYSVDIDDNGLTGQIPSEIGQLGHLIHLGLHNNGLTGDIPAEIGDLTNLDWLALAGNNLTGSIPPELGQLTNLRYIYLYSNSLTGSIPPELGQMSSLGVFSAMYSGITGAIPSELGNLSSLYGLFLYGNNLVGGIPSELGALPLDYLRLEYNSLSGTVPLPVAAVGAPLNDNCELRNNDPSLCMPNTAEYQALGNPICGLSLNSECVPIPDFSCASQTQIPESECDALVALFDSTGGPAWDDNAGWKTTNEPCSWYGVTCESGHVTEIDLSFNSMTGRIPIQFWDLTAMKVILMYYNYGLSGIIPAEVSQLTDLRRILIYSTSLEGSIPPALGSLDSLWQIVLSSNSLTGPIPPELGQLTKLQALGLGNNGLTGQIPPELGNTSLTGLDLGSNGLSGSIPPELSQLEELHDLILEDNELSGPIPSELGGLPELFDLSLSDNDLSGEIPSELGELSLLSNLYLSNNSLSGPIPPELGQLTFLTSLGLSNNNLSGPIPPELGNLSPDLLFSFRLESNALSGVVPLSVVQTVLELDEFACSMADNDPSLCIPDTPPYPAFPSVICGLPTSSECATGVDTVVFSVDLAPFAETGAFDPGRGDTVEVRGSFNGWDCDHHPDCLLTQRAGETVFEAEIPIGAVPGGSEIRYKYVFKPNMTGGAVAKSADIDFTEEWEEPYETGGANRSFILAEAAMSSQVLETVGFNDVHMGNVISAGDSIEVRFTVDMTEAFSDPAGPFNPSGGDEVHVAFNDALWRHSQSIPDYLEPDAIELQHVTGNTFSGTRMLATPLPSGILYKYVYGQPGDYNEEEGATDFDAPGRARVRYLLPFYDGSWPESWAFPIDTFRVAGALPVDSNHVTSQVELTAHVFLQGAYGSGSMQVVSQFAASRPLQQPYADTLFEASPLAYPHSLSVGGFSVGQVDWVEVELRRSTDPGSVPNGGKRLGILQRNGRITGLGGSGIVFPGIEPGRYYAVVRHRNHANVMSSSAVNLTSGAGTWNFKTGMGQAFSSGSNPMMDLEDGSFAMFAADANLDGQVTAADFNLWLTSTKMGETGYAQTDFDLDGQVTASDFNLWLKNTKLGASGQVPD